MARYRVHAPPKSPPITPEGHQALHAEQQDLWQKRREVVRALSAAAAEGDRSENAEYIYRKKQLRELDRRIRYLQKRIPDLHIVASTPSDSSRIFFGAWVTLEDEQGGTVTYRIVGADEFDPKRQWISVDSPLAKALLRRTVDDEVVVETPGGTNSFCVIDVQYESV